MGVDCEGRPVVWRDTEPPAMPRRRFPSGLIDGRWAALVPPAPAPTRPDPDGCSGPLNLSSKISRLRLTEENI